MQRETKTITTAGGVQAEIKTYLTGGETNAIKEDVYKMIKVDVTKITDAENMPVSGDIDATFLLTQEKKILEIIVVGLNGSTENISERIQALKNADYQEIVQAVTAVYKGSFPQAK